MTADPGDPASRNGLNEYILCRILPKMSFIRRMSPAKQAVVMELLVNGSQIQSEAFILQAIEINHRYILEQIRLIPSIREHSYTTSSKS